MTPFIALNLSPGSYLPKVKQVEKSIPVSLEVGVKSPDMLLSVEVLSGFYLWDDPYVQRAPYEPFVDPSSYYHTLSFTLAHRVRDFFPFLSVALAKPHITAMTVTSTVERFNSSVRGTTYGFQAGVGYPVRLGVLFLQPKVGVSYYPKLPIYAYDRKRDVVYPAVQRSLARVFVKVGVGIGK